MPIIASIPLNKLSDAVYYVINFIKKNEGLAILSVDINGYLFYKYRGMLFVRRGISHTFFRKDFHLLKNYLDYIINYLASENEIAWTKTVFIMEILIDILRNDELNFSIIIEINNDSANDYGNLKIRPYFKNEKEEKALMQEYEEEKELESFPSDILSIDKLIEREDMKKISPIDIYKVLTPREINEIISILKKLGAKCTISDLDEDSYQL